MGLPFDVLVFDGQLGQRILLNDHRLNVSLLEAVVGTQVLGDILIDFLKQEGFTLLL